MITAIVLSVVLGMSASSDEAADLSNEEAGFFETNWPTALDDELEPEVYENRVLLWAMLTVTWTCGGQIWLPGLFVKTPVAEGFQEAATWAYCTQLVPCCVCGPFSSLYIILNTMWMAPARGINLYNAYAKEARLSAEEQATEKTRKTRNGQSSKRRVDGEGSGDDALRY